MVSIFIWKGAEPHKEAPHCSTIRYDRGADWFSETRTLPSGMEENAAYQLIAITHLQDEERGDVLCYQAIKMPSEWVGQDLLECNTLPYCSIYQSDNNTIWDRIGCWERFMYKDTGEPWRQQWEDAIRRMRGENPERY
jgi:hypothetical protein